MFIKKGSPPPVMEIPIETICCCLPMTMIVDPSIFTVYEQMDPPRKEFLTMVHLAGRVGPRFDWCYPPLSFMRKTSLQLLAQISLKT